MSDHGQAGTQGVFDVDGLSRQYGLGPVDERFRRGTLIQHSLDPGLPATIQDLLAGVAPEFGRTMVEFVFGDIYARPGLDLRSRVLATLAAVTALNQTFAVKEYVRFALNNGFTRVEVVEVLIQMSVYAGMGPAMEALMAAKEVFAALDEKPQGAGSSTGAP